MIALVPVSPVDDALLTVLQEGLSDALGTSPVLTTLPINIEAAKDPRRNQYDSTRILLQLRSMSDRLPAGAGKVLSIVPHDLFIPVLTFVFGEAELGGNVAVASYYRLQNERYGLSADFGLLAERILKESLHEIGHMYGLTHCHEQECVMHSSTSVEEIDLKGSAFCDLCRISPRVTHTVPQGLKTGRNSQAGGHSHPLDGTLPL